MRYRLPPKDVVEILDALPVPVAVPDPKGRWMVLAHQRGLATILELSKPMLMLAGRRIDPRTNGEYTISTITRLSLVSLETGQERSIGGADGCLGVPIWAPDGSALVYTKTLPEGIELWAVDPERAEARRLTDAVLNGAAGDPVSWMPDGRRVICHFVYHRDSPPVEPEIPVGPIVQESSEDPSPARTYQDLLEDPHDEALYDHYLTSQPVLVDAGTGNQEEFGRPAIYESLQASPSGEYFLAVRTVRPYSYLVPDHRFSKQVEVWDAQGRLFRNVAKLGLDENGPEHMGFRRDGARGFSWRAQHPATLLYLEALDKGDPERTVPHRDRLLLLEAPFDGDPVELVRTEFRAGSGRSGLGPSVLWCEGGESALVLEHDWSSRRQRVWCKPSDQAEPFLLWDKSKDDWYGDPGEPVLKVTKRGDVVVRKNGDHIFLSGQGGSPEGDRPFLDSMDLRSQVTRRLFRSSTGSYEIVQMVLDEDGKKLLTSRESPTEPSNYYIVDMNDGTRRQLTSFPHPQPRFAGITKQRIFYERKDGVPLSAELYLPEDYDPGERLPLVVWAYPREYASKDGAGQVRGSSDRFTFVSGASHLPLSTQGYAVLDGAAMPIVGGLRANDTYLEQLVANAEAAVDKVVEMGVAERGRIAIAGHSYGAFMTANLLAHSDYFGAGIARSGAFNRSLTPFGFQFERRTYWDAPEVYNQMSAFMHADKINEPLLLIHGMMDNNPGTFPIQSERLYQALKGLGRTARLVLLPNESHGYRARESVLHTVWEMLEWLNRHLKARGPNPTGTEANPD